MVKKKERDAAKLAKREASKRKGWPIERITAKRELPELR